MTRPVFGVDRDPGVMMERAGKGFVPENRGKSGAWLVNPMVIGYGEGPADRRCHDCAHLIRSHGGSREYYKCDLRGVSSSATTDHRWGWPTCGLFEQAAASTGIPDPEP